MRTLTRFGLAAAALTVSSAALAQDAEPAAALGSLPIREVTVVKDGH